MSIIAKSLCACLLALTLLIPDAHAESPKATFETSRFGEIALFSEITPNPHNQFAILFADSADESTLLPLLLSHGFQVALVSSPKYLSELQADDDDCVFIGGELERLGQVIQKNANTIVLHTPILAGEGSGAAIAKIVAHQAPKGFRGVLVSAPLDNIQLPQPLCDEDSDFARYDHEKKTLHLTAIEKGEIPQLIVRPVKNTLSLSETHSAVSFLESLPPDKAFRNSAESDEEGELDDLPVVELAAEIPKKKYFMVLLSGDGGWASIDKELGEYFTKKGIDVVGFDSLKYFWSEKTPEEAAKALDRIITYYREEWDIQNVVLIGYSYGADVLPFLQSRLAAENKARVLATTLLNPSRAVDFEIHLSDWLNIDTEENRFHLPEELDKLPSARLLCIYGEEEKDESACPFAVAHGVQVRALPGSHHFDGDYRKLAKMILDFLEQMPAPFTPQPTPSRGGH